MAKKDKNQFRSSPNIFRIILFLAIIGGLVYWLSGQIETGELNDDSFIKGEIKGEEINKAIESGLPEIIKNQIDKINQRFHQQGDQIIRDTEEVVRQTKLAEEVERIISQSLDELEGFPEKQKNELKKEIINQVYQSLMKGLENDQDQE